MGYRPVGEVFCYQTVLVSRQAHHSIPLYTGGIVSYHLHINDYIDLGREQLRKAYMESFGRIVGLGLPCQQRNALDSYETNLLLQ